MGLLGSSKSESVSSVEQYDNRQVLDGGSVGLSGIRNSAIAEQNALNLNVRKGSANIQMLDGGVIADTFEFLEQMLGQTTSLVKDIQGQTQQLQEAQGAQLAAAYTDAKGQKDILIVGALLVGGIALLFFWKK